VIEKTNDFKSLAQNLMWMREVLIDQLRQMRWKLGEASGEEHERLDEYTNLLRLIVLSIGNLIDRIGVDAATDDPKLSNEIQAYLGNKL
jgi:hypothetical protein